jgi:hypothetical protein
VLPDAPPAPATTSRFGRGPILATIGVAAVAAVVLLAMGRVPICTCGYVKVWHGVVFSSENSQHLSDWYTYSHVIHGFAFYAVLWLAARQVAVGWRLVAAAVIESGWEILENTDLIINRYREATIALDYFGDSVINSVSDITAMVAGFLVAWRAPWPVTAAVAVFFELFVLYHIRDNLALNILMLLYPIDAIRVWQSGG